MKLARCLLTAAAATAALQGMTSMPAQAANIFGTSGIQFDADTIVDFGFAFSNNQFRSTLYVAEQQGASTTRVATLFEETRRSNNETTPPNWLATCGAGGAVANCSSQFTFRAGVLYTLELFSVALEEPVNGPRVPSMFSTSALNGGTQRVLFGSLGSAGEGVPFPDPGNFTSANPFAGIVALAFEDGAYRTEPEDFDFNDFYVFASATLAPARPVPTPSVMGGLMLVGAIAYFNHRRQIAQKQKI
ncbi:hypothetical protein [Leptothermofonsia sp. ETS-13]|uniref:hypothetical protein n=1 Tax=Leptothermofonsia sp. ETS-13 TaxID=3035696 RepID=UPI003BA05F8B